MKKTVKDLNINSKVWVVHNKEIKQYTIKSIKKNEDGGVNIELDNSSIYGRHINYNKTNFDTNHGTAYLNMNDAIINVKKKIVEAISYCNHTIEQEVNRIKELKKKYDEY